MKAPLVVLGATGGVGRGVVQAAIDAGRPVIAVARRSSELKALKAGYPQADLTVLAGSVANDAAGAKLARALRKLGRPFAGVVAAVCGSAERGRLLDSPAQFLRRKLDEDLLPHLAAARHLLPLLAESDRGGTYVLIGGPGSEHPWAGYGHRSIGAAALRMLARVLHDEARQQAVRVQLLAVDTPVCTEFNQRHSCPEWPSALSVGQRALALIDHDAGDEPPRPIVPYAVRAPGPALLPPRIRLPSPPASREHATPASSAPPATRLPAISTAPTSPAPTSTNTVPKTVPLPAAAIATAQEPDCTSDDKTQRCLLDARALLKSLTAPNPKQEPTPR
ncbi:SDR family NAD(P)-dependent oxidoreductase [Lysobacter yananisis]|uniref:SDR family NAD(P)-dependent oxidoreductase n=1 Tax=Lysobacter yananisis TaxID=1003114 RepID=A0ABY9PCQ3_9GAMM|nr:SDR family NAD(P)-dependent oxidoreductase [Lysobacter yananisis]WMT04649.1 SDR family NAD(P)-dependent oxidoreductase [Lysobacter yananisis]